MKHDLKDRDLVESYLSGDKSSLDALVKRWHKIFFEKDRVMRKLIKSKAACVSETALTK